MAFGLPATESAAMNQPIADAGSKPRVTARERELRRLRIFAAVREGRTHEEIAEAEGLSSERIRQIVRQTLDRRDVDAMNDHTRLQLARLEPMLQLTTEKAMAGDLRGVELLLKVLERVDQYHRAVAVVRDEERSEGKFKEKLVDLVRRARALKEKEAAAAGTRGDAPAPAGAGGGGEPQGARLHPDLLARY
jgi:hypothetical protein